MSVHLIADRSTDTARLTTMSRAFALAFNKAGKTPPKFGMLKPYYSIPVRMDLVDDEKDGRAAHIPAALVGSKVIKAGEGF